MNKRFFLILSFLLFITWSTAACDSGIKMVKRNTSGTTTMTPFLPKATFTIVSTPGQYNADGEDNQSTQTATVEPTLSETTSEVVQTGEPTSTPSITQTPDSATSTVTAAGDTTTPSATTKPVEPTNTATLSMPSATPKPGEPSATPAPTRTSSLTPSQPPSTYTPKPPSATPEPPASQTPDGCTISGNSTYENQVINLINKERTDRSLSALSQNTSLRLAARWHSEDMACNDFFSHTGSDGSTLSSRVLAAGYSYSWAAENIAASSNCSFSAQSVVNMWMNSTGHRNNILSSNAVHIGVGFYCASDSTSGDLDAYYTADFGRP